MNRYTATLEFLYNRLPMFQRTGPPAYKHSLDTTIQLDGLYNHPHRNYATIHVAGTNGKGSVSHMLASILQSSGYRTGLFTSPHLKDFRERIRVDGQMIEEQFVSDWVDSYRSLGVHDTLQPSFFELTAIMAFDYFSQQKVDVAVIEVGLGGRLDSTNIINPVISIITNISLDHTELLGDTLPLIAAEKAGIIKPEVPIVISQRHPETAPVFVSAAGLKRSPLWFGEDFYHVNYSLVDIDGYQRFAITSGGKPVYPDLKSDLAGSYQRYNLPGVLKGIDLLVDKGWNIPGSAIYNGLAQVRKNTSLQGRWQTLGVNPRIVCDTGHNQGGIAEVTEQIRQTPYKRLHVVFGTVADKDPSGVLKLLPTDATYYFCQADIPRALNARQLKKTAADFGLIGDAYESVAEAYAEALKAAETDDFIFIGGSTFVVAEIL